MTDINALSLGTVTTTANLTVNNTGALNLGTSTAATCVRASIMSTPGMTGIPGKCPWKNSSPTVTFLYATSRFPGSCSMTPSTNSAALSGGAVASA